MILPSVERDMANPAWESAGARILIARLSPWRDVDISTPHLVLFDEIRRSMPEAYVDFAFLPTAADRKALSARGIPWFFGRASKKSPRDFDVVMISNAFALELINLPYLFSTAGIQASAAARAGEDGLPAIVAGGSNASAMGGLVQESPGERFPARDAIVDGIFFGEGEGAIGPLARLLAGTEDAGRPAAGDRAAAARRERLAHAAALPGFWPCLLSSGAKRALSPTRPDTVAKPLVHNGPNASSARLSITAGCPGYCSFCLEGWDRRPYAEADIDRLLATARELRRATGAEDLELYSFNFNTHARIFDLIFELNRIFRRVSFMSQRLDILASTPGLAEVERAGGKSSFTLGIEGISGGMRAWFRKGLTDEAIDACLDKTIAPGVKELKLFFIAAGVETEDDIAEFAALMKRADGMRRARSPSTRIIASAGYLVRLPFTPLQYAPFGFDRAALDLLGRRLGAACEEAGIEFRLASEPIECFVDQALSLGGDAAYRWLSALPATGIVYDGSLPEAAWKNLESALRKEGLLEKLGAEKGPLWRPPLSFIAEDRDFETLYGHYLATARGEDRPSCLGGRCSACGVCADAEQIRSMTGHRIEASEPRRQAGRVAALLAAKNAFPPVGAILDIPEELAGAERAYLESWALRSLSAAVPGAESVVFEARETLFSQGAPFCDLFAPGDLRFGFTSLALYGPDTARTEALLRRLGGGADGRFRIADESHAGKPAVAELEIRLNRTGMEVAKRRFEAYAESQGLAFTARRSGDGWKFDFAEAAQNRRAIVGATLGAAAGDGLVLAIAAKEKARISPLLDEFEKAEGSRPAARVAGWR
ncbi:hypothetical protein LWX53_02025 [bacterium]|nr:hypothetical protein [bacterium]